MAGETSTDPDDPGPAAPPSARRHPMREGFNPMIDLVLWSFVVAASPIALALGANLIGSAAASLGRLTGPRPDFWADARPGAHAVACQWHRRGSH